ncbi:GTPase [Winogradskyella sp. 3972H.M.0a.05]|uniref:GTPase n=1 Tax=Winogradskyella sp. 3972H.M.0a.05 TaxID=2950277 RepID=UPI0033942E5C
MKLIFVYNANSGKLNALLDSGHKLFSPNTYKCQLCAITHGTFSEKKQWKQFRENTNLDMEFYHIDEFEAQYPDANFKFPIILKEELGKLTTVVSSEDFKDIEDIEALINRINTCVKSRLTA